jgi:hypothetical protein
LAQRHEKIDGVLQDVHLVLKAGEDVNGGIGYGEHLVVGGDVHEEDMADPPRRPQARVALDHLAHELVGVKASLHQECRSPKPDQLDRPGRSGVAIGDIDYFVGRDVEL